MRATIHHSLPFGTHLSNKNWTKGILKCCYRQHSYCYYKSLQGGGQTDVLAETNTQFFNRIPITVPGFFRHHSYIVTWKMPPRQVRRKDEVERENFMSDIMTENGLIWDIIINDFVRHGDFGRILWNVKELYANAGNRHAQARRRIGDFMAREQRNGLPERVNEMRYAGQQMPLIEKQPIRPS